MMTDDQIASLRRLAAGGDPGEIDSEAIRAVLDEVAALRADVAGLERERWELWAIGESLARSLSPYRGLPAYVLIAHHRKAISAGRSRAVREDLDLAPRADRRVPALGAEGREIEGGGA